MTVEQSLFAFSLAAIVLAATPEPRLSIAVVGQVLPGTADAVRPKLANTTGMIREREPSRMSGPSNQRARPIMVARAAGAR